MRESAGENACEYPLVYIPYCGYPLTLHASRTHQKCVSSIADLQTYERSIMFVRVCFTVIEIGTFQSVLHIWARTSVQQEELGRGFSGYW